MSDAEREGLARFGIEVPTAVREPATDPRDRAICPECGEPVGGTLGTQRIARPTVLDEDLAGVTELPTLGYVCSRHKRDVVLPVDPSEVSGNWIAVEVELADGRSRAIPVPAPEVEHGE